MLLTWFCTCIIDTFNSNHCSANVTKGNEQSHTTEQTTIARRIGRIRITRNQADKGNEFTKDLNSYSISRTSESNTLQQ